MLIVFKLLLNFYNYDFKSLYKLEVNVKNKIRFLVMLYL